MSWPQTPARGMLRLPRHVVRGAHHERERPQEATARRTDEWERLLPLPGSAEAFFLTQAVSTVGTEPAGIQRCSIDINSLTYAGFPHTYGLLHMTENHGVPGSNPGPATNKSPANSGKRRCTGSAAEIPYWRRVNSRIQNRSLLMQLSRRLACLCGEGVNSEGHPVIGVTWTGETRGA